ncbi:ABC transporter ATP-binding protein [Microbacterium sp.]|uniref:energy-coupling factor ABC transporter ATP-binding protein n=1 Tax=Microbacterium sp. TaxID=51671 RepID=UPI00260EAFE4|nr:ABC transporter ATP-binding protein [Microbacterium sp.]
MPAPEHTSSAPARIVLHDVSVTLDARRILEDVSLEVDAHRIAVIGANGSGKSTFARLLNGLVKPSSGSVHVHGVDAVARPAEARHRVGFVFSSPDAQILMPTVAEDVALSLNRSGLDRADVTRRVEQTLAAYGLIEHADAPAYTLSGGQKQLLALASVLVRRPHLLVADEPTTLLDRGNARRVGNILIDELPMQVVIVTHDLELARRCDVAVLFDRGRVQAVGAADEIIGGYERMFV